MPELLDGRLSLTTPEGVRLSLTPAGLGARAGAWMIDFLLWLACMIVLSIVFSFMGGVGAAAMYLSAFLTFWFYPVICEVYFNGRTIGKRAVGTQVLRSDGLPVGWRESMTRNLLWLADFMPAFYLTGFFCMLTDKQFRRVGDIVARTQVVYVEKAHARTPLSKADPLPLPYALTAEQQRVLIDLFERERSLPPARMIELGTIAEPLTGLQGRESVERMRRYVADLVQ